MSIEKRFCRHCTKLQPIAEFLFFDGTPGKICHDCVAMMHNMKKDD